MIAWQPRVVAADFSDREIARLPVREIKPSHRGRRQHGECLGELHGGIALGVVHAALAGGALLTVLLPAVHPRMGTPWSDAEETPLLEAPGFLLMNYGRRTALWTLVGHIVYGAIVGGFAAQLG